MHGISIQKNLVAGKYSYASNDTAYQTKILRASVAKIAFRRLREGLKIKDEFSVLICAIPA